MHGRVDETDERDLTNASRPGGRHRDRRPLSPPVALGLTVAAMLTTLGGGVALLPDSITGSGAPAESPTAFQSPAPDTVAAGAGGSDQAGGAPGATPTPPTAAPTAKPTKAPAKKPRAQPTTAAPAAKPRIISGHEAEESEVIRLTNVERVKKGCAKVTLDLKLRAAIRAHTQDMATKGYFSHDSLDGRSPWDRAKAAGYRTPIGENIAKGQPSAADVMHSWMNSAGHKANILNCDAKAIGVGLSYDGGTPIWGQLFGSV